MDNNLQIEDKLEKYTIHIDSLNCNLQNNNTEIYVDLDNDIKNCIYFKTLKSEIFVNSLYKYNSLIDGTDNNTYFRKGDEVYIDVNGIERIIVKEKKYVPIKAKSLKQYGLEWERFFDIDPSNTINFDTDTDSITLENNLRTNNWLENNILIVDGSLITNLEDDIIQEKYFRNPAFNKNKIYYKVKKRYYTNKKILGTKWIKSSSKGTGKEFNNLQLLQNLHPGLNWIKLNTDIHNVEDGFTKINRENTIKYFLADYDVLNWTNVTIQPSSGTEINNKYIRHYLSNKDFLKWEKITISEYRGSGGILTTKINDDMDTGEIRDLLQSKITSSSSLPSEVIISIDEWPITNNIRLDELYYENDDNTTAYIPKDKVVQNNIDFDILYDDTKIDLDTISTDSWIISNSQYYTINTKNVNTRLTPDQWKLTGIDNITAKNYVRIKGIDYIPKTQYYFTEQELQNIKLIGKISKNDYIKFNNNTYYLPDYDNLGNTGYVFNGTKLEITKFDINDADNYGDLVLYNNTSSTKSARNITFNTIDYSQILIDNIYLTDKRYYDKIDITNDLDDKIDITNDEDPEADITTDEDPVAAIYIFKNELTGTSCGPNDTNTVILNPILPELKRFTVKLYKINEFGEHEPIKIDKDGVYRVKVSFTIYYKRKKITRV
jgi:hypothetical protein|uniref:Uncharacterized protein n=1 Tax=viral metagenome TaxID=1070528 RepID=A0A6C0JU05_9ZZZZ